MTGPHMCPLFGSSILYNHGHLSIMDNNDWSQRVHYLEVLYCITMDTSIMDNNDWSPYVSIIWKFHTV